MQTCPRKPYSAIHFGDMEGTRFFLWLIQMFACFFLHLPYISKSFRKLTRWKLKRLLFEYPQREDPISPSPKVRGETCKIQAGGLGPSQGPGAGRRVTGSGLPHPPVPPCLDLTFIYAKGNKQNGGEYIWGCLYKLYIYICTAHLLSWVWLLAASPMDCSRPASSVHGIFPGKNTGMGCHFFLQGIFPTQGSNLHLLCLLHWQAGSLPLAPLGKPYIIHIYIYIMYVCILKMVE